jgi:hypothetical protein
VPASQIDEIRAIVSGPSWNANQLLVTTIPRALLTGTQPFTFRLPELRQYELVGHSTASTGDVFTTARSPHVVGAGAATTVRVRTGTTGAASALAAATAAPQNFVDVADGSAFARDDDVVVDDGTPSEEYARIQLVDGNRLWFSSPSTPGYPAGLALPHPPGATVLAVALSVKTAGADYALDAASGTITEVSEFGAGAAVVVTYTTEFALPAVHPLALNASPDLDETSGKWTGKSLVPGTYTLTLTGFRNVFQNYNFELNVLRDTSKPATADFLVGGATTIEPYALISDPENCYRCHTDLWFHDGQYRGFETCIACHGQAGSEDLPRYVAANAPATTGVTVNFRTLLHQIHRGSSLAARPRSRSSPPRAPLGRRTSRSRTSRSTRSRRCPAARRAARSATARRTRRGSSPRSGTIRRSRGRTSSSGARSAPPATPIRALSATSRTRRPGVSRAAPSATPRGPPCSRWTWPTRPADGSR